MLLHFNGISLLNCRFSNGSGQVLYKSESEVKGDGKSTVITKVVPNEAPGSPGVSRGEDTTTERGEESVGDESLVEDEPDMQDKYQYMASIKWNIFAPAVLVFPGDKKINIREFFSDGGSSFFGRKWIWRAADGRQYEWKLGTWDSTLVVNDGKDKPVAKYHRKKYGLHGKTKGEPFLDIADGSGGEKILDEIVLTLIYVESPRSGW